MNKLISKYKDRSKINIMFNGIISALFQFNYTDSLITGIATSVLVFFLYTFIIQFLEIVTGFNILRKYRKQSEGYILNAYWYKKQLTEKAFKNLKNKEWENISHKEIVETILFSEHNLFSNFDSITAFENYFTLTKAEALSVFINIDFGSMDKRLEWQNRYLKSLVITDRVKLLKNDLIFIKFTDDVDNISDASMKRTSAYTSKCEVALRRLKQTLPHFDRIIETEEGEEE